jgi:membrane-associated phospholipid phosphatase
MAKKRYLVLGMAAYFLLMILLAEFDLDFSVRMTDGASAVLIEAGRRIGPLPALLIPAVSLRALGEFMKLPLLKVLAALLCAGAGYSITIPLLSEPVSVALCLMFSVLLYNCLRMLPLPEDTKKNRTILWIGVFCVAFGFLLIQLMKYVWGRPRFKAIVLEDAEFRTWLNIEGFEIRNDLYRSFPSAHAFCSAVSFLLVFLPDLYPDESFRRSHCGILAVLFTGFTMYSRIIAGMHFISDVMAGTGLFLLIFLITVLINWRILYGQPEETDSSVHDGTVRE